MGRDQRTGRGGRGHGGRGKPKGKPKNKKDKGDKKKPPKVFHPRKDGSNGAPPHTYSEVIAAIKLAIGIDPTFRNTTASAISIVVDRKYMYDPHQMPTMEPLPATTPKNEAQVKEAF